MTPTNLPGALTSFIGRGPEIEAVKRLVAGARLVTLTGAGGIGKTRLAVEAAAQSTDAFPGGVWLVELAALTDPDLVPQATLTTLGFNAQPGRTALESLAATLGRTPKTLLILDNCEHLVAACAALAHALLKDSRDLRLLATSREVLGVEGEVVWPVPSMATPDARGTPNESEIAEVDSVRLFAERAHAARPGFRPARDNIAVVARICRRLDGIPLAIELAAARVRTMSVAAIEERLDDRFALLTRGNRTSVERHRTLLAAVDWSYALLDDVDRRLLRRLAVFRGGFTLDDAQGVCAEDARGPGSAILDGVSSLVDKSLVVADEQPDRSMRYRLLESIREYAWDRLAEAGESDRMQRLHALHYFALADEAYDQLRGPAQAIWLARIEDEFENLRASFDWGLEQEPAKALQLAARLRRYWLVSQRLEGFDWLTRALAKRTERDELRAEALREASWRALFQGRFDAARSLALECLQLADDGAGTLHRGRALQALGLVTSLAGTDGHLERATAFFEQAETPLRESGDDETLAFSLNDQGLTLHFAGDSSAGRARVEEALEIARRAEDRLLIAPFVESLAIIEFDVGNHEKARTHWQECLVYVGELHSLFSGVYTLIGLARLAVVDGEPERCLSLFGAAEELAQRVGLAIDPELEPVVAQARAAAAAMLDAERADAAWQRGAAMSWEQAIAYARNGAPESEHDERFDRAGASAQSLAAGNAFIREGEFWTIGFAGRVVRLKESKGLHDLALLLRSPGRQVAAIDLASSPLSESSGTAGRRELGSSLEGDAGPALDAEARRSYRARLEELEEDATEAERMNDTERASRVRSEREFLLAELAAAVGLGGRARRMGDPAERARKAVTWRIRQAIDRIESVHPELGRHLRRSVRTGALCGYDPPEPTSWDISDRPRAAHTR